MAELSVDVAVLPAFEIVFDVPGGSPRPGTPWSELPHVGVRATADDTLRTVMRHACDTLGIDLTEMARQAEEAWLRKQGGNAVVPHVAEKLVYAGFWQPDDDDVVAGGEFPILRRDSRTNLTVVVVTDAKGHAIWRRPALDATMGELLQAAEAGLINGDPLRPYLVPSIPQGIRACLASGRRSSRRSRSSGSRLRSLRPSAVRSRSANSSTRSGDGERAKHWTPSNGMHLVGQIGARHLRISSASLSQPNEHPTKSRHCSAVHAMRLRQCCGASSCTTKQPDGGARRGDPLAEVLADDVDYSFADVFIGDPGQKRLATFAEQHMRRFLETGEPPPRSATSAEIEHLRERCSKSHREALARD